MSYLSQIAQYNPYTEKEKKIKEQVLKHISIYKDTLLTRENELIHFTSSSFILNETLDKVLFVHHNIYDSFCWTGGHVDGDSNFLHVAEKEGKEETNISNLFLLSKNIISLDVLPVPAHTKNGMLIEKHQHISIAYAFIAKETDTISPNLKENTAVVWIPIDQLQDTCKEQFMVEIYQKILQRIQEDSILLERIQLASIVTPLLNWFGENKRDLPWRKSKNPYHIWVSEIMLQQTRVEAVKSYFSKFTEKLPTISDLAKAEDDLLLKLWQGLGYYNRVKNMKKAAQIIESEYQGCFPQAYSQILALPGIGTYTTGAISSIAFGHPTPAIDGNVIRVITRLCENGEDMEKSAAKKIMNEQLSHIYPLKESGNFTESLMELGATICLPKGSPLCQLCPIAFACHGYKHQTMENFPMKKVKKKRKIQEKTMFILTYQNFFAIEKRKETGLLSSLWQLPNQESYLSSEEIVAYLNSVNLLGKEILPLPESKHIFTHIEWNMKGYLIPCTTKNKDFLWVTKKEMEEKYAIPSAFSDFLPFLPTI